MNLVVWNLFTTAIAAADTFLWAVPSGAGPTTADRSLWAVPSGVRPTTADRSLWAVPSGARPTTADHKHFVHVGPAINHCFPSNTSKQEVFVPTCIYKLLLLILYIYIDQKKSTDRRTTVFLHSFYLPQGTAFTSACLPPHRSIHRTILPQRLYIELSIHTHGLTYNTPHHSTANVWPHRGLRMTLVHNTLPCTRHPYSTPCWGNQLTPRILPSVSTLYSKRLSCRPNGLGEQLFEDTWVTLTDTAGCDCVDLLFGVRKSRK